MVIYNCIGYVHRTFQERAEYAIGNLTERDIVWEIKLGHSNISTGLSILKHFSNTTTQVLFMYSILHCVKQGRRNTRLKIRKHESM